jgi:YggT family protein
LSRRAEFRYAGLTALLEDRLLTLIDIARILLSVLWWILIVQIVLSWLIAFNVINTSNDFVRSVWNGLNTLTEPLYRPIRRILPDFGALDLSPMVVFVGVLILDRVLAGLAANIASGGAVPL